MSSSSKREVGSARPSSATNKGAASGSLSARSAHPSESNTRPVSATSTTRGSHSGSLSARSAPSSTAAKQRLAQPASARGSRPTTAFGGLDDDAPKEVPAKILDQAKLSGQLNLANRNLTSLPDRVWALDDEPMVLDQPSQGLSTDTVPDFNAQRNSDDERNSWWNRTLMQKLLLANNQLTSLDEGLGRLRMLTTLDISHNQLQTLPEAIGECTKLQRMLL
uniref:Uncharacterized protein n=1 Tax=Plectus sambesii TaxID=2011161 RepID=A0A914UHW1_9BILA